MAIIREVKAVLYPGSIPESYELRIRVRLDHKEYEVVSLLPPEHLASMWDRLFDKIKAELLHDITK